MSLLWKKPRWVHQKQAAFDRLVKDYRQLRREWQGFSGYDAWFKRKLNNARLASVATYEEWTPAFELLSATALMVVVPSIRLAKSWRIAVRTASD